MGFQSGSAEVASSLWETLEPLMRRSNIDYTIFWRQLAAVARNSDSSSDPLFSFIESAFYEDLSDELRAAWNDWLHQWISAHSLKDSADKARLAELLCQVNPKY